MGVALEWPHRSLTAAINVATSAAPLTAKFAESLLTPASGAGFQSGLVDFRADRVHLPKILLRLPAFGVHAYASASSRVWQSLSDTAGHQKATILGLGAMAFTRAEFVSADTANRVSIAGELGFSARHISGDLGQDRELRMALLQTDRRWFYGLEGGLTISINKITAAMQVYYYFHRIQGIGSCQMTTGLSLQADLFSFRNHPTVNRRTAGI